MNVLSDPTFRAEIIPCADLSSDDRLQALRAIPGIEFIDTLPVQVADLVKTRAPAKAFDEQTLKTTVESFLRENGGERYGVWAYYAWSKRVVRLLPEADFIELRTSRNQHKITASEQRSLATRKVGVVGLSVGQSVALTLALERACGELRIADFDAIDLSNLNRLRCGVHHLGVLKTIAAAREIAEIDPYFRVVCFHDGYVAANEDAFLDGLDVVVDECDSLDIKLRLRESARDRRIPVLMSTSDRGMVDIERFDREPERPIFHGRLQGIKSSELSGLSTEQKIPILLNLAGVPWSSPRLRASLLEIGETIRTWPQLAADVTFGGAAICDVARRVLLDEPVASGCYYTDFARIGDPAAALPIAPRVSETAVNHVAEAAPVDDVATIVADAGLAPSTGNEQPWLWERTANGLVLRQRPVSHASPVHADNKMAMVALGATLENAVISAKHRGFDAEVDIELSEDRVANLSLRPGTGQPDEPLFAQLRRRQSVRSRPEQRMDLPAEIFETIDRELERFPGLHLHVLTRPEDIREAADLAGEAESMRLFDPLSHQDLAAELCWSDAEHVDRRTGIPFRSLALSSAEFATMGLLRDTEVMRTMVDLNLGSAIRKLSARRLDTSTAIALLWSDSDSHIEYLRGGQALQRVWLAMTAADIGLCPLAANCAYLNLLRSGVPLTERQAKTLPVMEQRFRRLYDLPEQRANIVQFRLIPAAPELAQPSRTLRLPLEKILVDRVSG